MLGNLKEHLKQERWVIMRCEVIDEGFVKVGRCNYLRHDEMTLTQKMS